MIYNVYFIIYHPISILFVNKTHSNIRKIKAHKNKKNKVDYI